MKKDRIISDGQSVTVKRKGRKWLVRGAAIVLAAIILTSGILMLNPGVRSAVFGVFSGRSSEVIKDGSLYGVRIGYLPEGFTADRENATVEYGKYGEPTCRRIEFVRESELEYLKEPWVGEVDGFSGYNPPRIEVVIGRPGTGVVPDDLSELDDGLYAEDVTFGKTQGQVAYAGGFEFHNYQNDWATSYWILLYGEDVTVLASVSGFEDDDVIKFAEGITW